ncbi:hypothetical protein [Intestinimonas sp. HCP28S3_D6]
MMAELVGRLGHLSLTVSVVLLPLLLLSTLIQGISDLIRTTIKAPDVG